jgi:hypothetical protein
LKKVLVYTTLALFLFNSIGYYLLFEMSQFLIKMEMSKEIVKNQKPLVVLCIADAEQDEDFRRIHKGEIQYKGKMYDVEREYKSWRTSVFFCLQDTREDNLMTGLNKAHLHKLFQALWDQLTTVTFPEQLIEMASVSSSGFSFPRFNASLQTTWLQTLSPPPKVNRS